MSQQHRALKQLTNNKTQGNRSEERKNLRKKRTALFDIVYKSRKTAPGNGVEGRLLKPTNPYVNY